MVAMKYFSTKYFTILDYFSLNSKGTQFFTVDSIYKKNKTFPFYLLF